MASSDKIRIATSVPSKIYIGKRRVTKIYRADLKNQIFPFTPPLPVIDSVDPATANTSGGSTVVITGEYYSTATSVKFGSTSASFIIDSSMTIIATVPAGALGSADITVTNATGVSNAFPFSYINAATAAGMESPAAWNATPYTENTWLPVLASFVVRSGFPATVIDNDALVVSGSGPISGTFFGNYTTRLGTQQFRIVRIRNGETTVLATANLNSTSTFTDNVIQGDRIMMECFYSTQYRNVSAGTYVYFNPA